MTGYEAIASFETADGAAAATSHLVELGYAEHEVGIEPHAYEIVRPNGLGTTTARYVRLAAVAGAVIAAVVAAFVTVEADGLRAVAMAGVAGLCLGAILGAAFGVVRFLRRRSQRFVDDPDRMRPNRFDVIVSREPERGNHALARWWDPDARPARRRSTT